MKNSDTLFNSVISFIAILAIVWGLVGLPLPSFSQDKKPSAGTLYFGPNTYVTIRIDTSGNVIFLYPQTIRSIVVRSDTVWRRDERTLNEQETMQCSHIDFSTQYITFVLHGKIEIDGHTFLNDTCRLPVRYNATLDGVQLLQGEQEYVHRFCSLAGCKVIHLRRK